MAWLVHEGEVLASLEVASSATARRRGLLGRDEVDGALLLQPARMVHTLRMRFPIDVIFCDDHLCVLDIVTMAPNRIGAPRWKAGVVIEAPAGAAARWNLRRGEQLDVKE
jgi:hypothetical protein